MLREYTLFLDPPTLPVAPPIRRVEETPQAAPAAEPVLAAPPTARAEPEPTRVAPAPRPAPPRVRDPEPVSEPQPETSVTQPAAAEPMVSAPEVQQPAVEPRSVTQPASVGSRSVGPVAPGRTLWSIALLAASKHQLTMNPVMLAILDRNPQAFIDGNVNQLRRDAILDMPSSDEMANIGVSDADRRMRPDAGLAGWFGGR